MHHYQFNIGNYKKDTAHLTPLEHGVYRTMMDSYYTNEGALEADDAFLMRTHCIRSADEKEAYQNVLSDFFELRDGSYHHAGCDKVLTEIYEKSDKARASAEARWAKKKLAKQKGSGAKIAESSENESDRTEEESGSDADGMRSHSEGSASGMLPITYNPLPNNPVKDMSASQPSHTKKFVPPTVEEIVDYLSPKYGTQFDVNHEAERFINFYESKGWVVGKTKMKNWKSSASNWALGRVEENGQRKQVSGNGAKKSKSEQARDAADEVFGSDYTGAERVIENDFEQLSQLATFT